MSSCLWFFLGFFSLVYAGHPQKLGLKYPSESHPPWRLFFPWDNGLLHLFVLPFSFIPTAALIS